MSKKGPTERNLKGFLQVQRHAIPAMGDLNEKEFRLYWVLLTVFDWDRLHPRFSQAEFSYRDLEYFLKTPWSDSSYSRTIKGLVDKGRVRRLDRGEYELLGLDEVVSIKERKSPRAAVIPPRVTEATPLLGTPTPQVGLKTNSLDDLMSVKKPKQDLKKSNKTASISELKCRFLEDGSPRSYFAQTFLEVSGHLNLSPEGVTTLWRTVQGIIVDYHQGRAARNLPCDDEGCLRRPIDMIRAMTQAKTSAAGYLKTSLNGLLSCESDRFLKKRERESQRRNGTSKF